MSTRADITDVKFEDSILSSNILQGLALLRQSEQFTDVALKGDGVELPCHRVVLAAASPYFKTMFSSGFRESASSTVEIRGTNHETLETVINYIYSAEIKLTTANVKNLLQASTEYQLDSLQDSCEKFMLQQLVAANCVEYYKFAKLFDLKMLQDQSRVVMLKEFESLCAPELNKLTEAEIVEYIADSNLHAPSEDAVFEAVTTWVNSDVENRSAAFGRVLAHVRLPYCTDAFLNDVVKNEPLMKSAPICLKYVEDIKKCQEKPTKRKCFGVSRNLVVVGGEDENKSPIYICCSLNEAGKWDLLTEIPLYEDTMWYSACVVPSGILVTGGKPKEGLDDMEGYTPGKYWKNAWDNRADDQDCWLFDMASKEWKAMPRMIEGRTEHMLVMHWNQVYAIGGYLQCGTMGTTNTVECLDLGISEPAWKKVQPMKADLASAQVVSFGQNIYVFGGICESGIVGNTSSQMYSPVWGKWTSRADMPMRCHSGSAVAINDQIYLVGGFRNCCMSYKPELDTWTVLSGPMKKHSYSGAVVWKGKILVGGGVQTVDRVEQVTDTIEEYDPVTDTWSFWTPSLDMKLMGMHMLSIDMEK